MKQQEKNRSRKLLIQIYTYSRLLAWLPRMSCECGTIAQGCTTLSSVTAILLLPPDQSAPHFTSILLHTSQKSWGLFSDFKNGQKRVIVGFYIIWLCKPMTLALFKTSGFTPPCWYQYCDLVCSRCWQEGEKKGKSIFVSSPYISFPFFSWNAPNVNNVCR